VASRWPTPGVVLADASYWHQRQIEAVMRRVLATLDGRALHRRRQATIEPVFGQLKFNRQMGRFQRRGRAVCRSEWRLIAATHNLLKLYRHQIAAAPAAPLSNSACVAPGLRRHRGVSRQPRVNASARRICPASKLAICPRGPRWAAPRTRTSRPSRPTSRPPLCIDAPCLAILAHRDFPVPASVRLRLRTDQLPAPTLPLP
jgi:hypothetical protein